MATAVEVYFQEELKELVVDENKLEEWETLVQKLGLENQMALQDAEARGAPIPFTYMNEHITNMFEILCPMHQSLNEFKATPIPLEGLRMISLAQREKYFTKIEVWYAEKDPDPVLIGLVKDFYFIYENTYQKLPDTPTFKNRSDAEFYEKEHLKHLDPHSFKLYDWNTPTRYLMARWGDERKTFQELKDKAKILLRAQMTSEAERQIREAKRNLEDLEMNILDKLGV